eukprot:m.30461 g.30461  ORF g.30461 m.30461 type:complete len:255 (-) comp10609_c0_seq4:218-982(-)
MKALLINAVYRLLSFVLFTIVWISSTLRWIWRSFSLSPVAFTSFSPARVKRYTQRWTKTPNHLCIAVADEPVVYEPIARLVMWAIAAGVKHISIWDNQGLCTASAGLLQKYLEKAHVSYFGAQCDDYPLKFDQCSPGDRLSASTEKQANETPDHIHVHLCDDSHGRGAIVSAVGLATKTKANVTQEWLDKALTRNMPEIDLVLMFSRQSMVYGLLPWHLRVAEILFCGSHQKATAKTFVAALDSFANCEQRYGK